MKTKTYLDTPHYQCESWEIEEEKLSCIRIWSSAYLNGLQFVSQQREGPKWGLCENEPTASIYFDETDGTEEHAVSRSVETLPTLSLLTYLLRWD